jgi:hypothetical protein
VIIDKLRNCRIDRAFSIGTPALDEEFVDAHFPIAIVVTLLTLPEAAYSHDQGLGQGRGRFSIVLDGATRLFRSS